jgi:hypothetical protein
VIRFLAAFAFSTAFALFVWCSWLGLRFGYQVEKGQRLTLGSYQKIRWQTAILCFLAANFMVAGMVLGSGTLDFGNANDRDLVLCSFLCCPSLLTAITLISLWQPSGRFVPD